MGSKEDVDLSRFSVSGITEGQYSVDVYTNDKWQGRHDLQIKELPGKKLGICYTPKMLSMFGVNFRKLNDTIDPDSEQCLLLSEWNNSPQVTDEFKASTLQLYITVPQIYLLNAGRFISPESWDKGIPAANVSYMANYYGSKVTDDNSRGGGAGDDDTFYASVNAGVSAGGWLLKHNGNYNWQRSGEKGWHSNQTYLQRPVPPMGAKLTAGQFTTEGYVMESVRLRGLKLATDDNMYPDGAADYAPEIRGIAQSNALVTVRQNDMVVYQTSVPAGPFELRDVQPFGFGNDLIVTIKEADGRESSFTVPYTASTKMVRPGFLRYAVGAGKTDMDGMDYKPKMMQGSVQYGLNNLLTVYSGTNISEDYYALQAGSGINTPVGTFSLDVTGSRTKFSNKTVSGENYQASYSQMMPVTKTNMFLSYYYRPNRDYYAVNNALYALNADRNRELIPDYAEKSGFIYSVNQTFPEGFGSIFLSGRFINYWDRDTQDKQYQVSYNNAFGKLSYSLSFLRTYSRSYDQQYNDSFNLNLIYPLSFGDGKRATISSNTWMNDGSFRSSQLSLNGSFDDNNSLTYGVSASAMKDNNYASSVNLGYRSPYTYMNGNYSYGKKYRQYGLSMSGSAVAHSGGITLTPEISDTMALAEAPDAKGASLQGLPTSRFDGNGYLLVPYVRPYRVNNIEVDPKGSPEDIAFRNTATAVAPYEGAIVKVKFETKIEKNIAYKVMRTNDRPLPFGAEVKDAQGNIIGVVSQGSVVLMNDENAQQGIVAVGKGTCTFTLDPAKRQNSLCQ